MVALPRTRTTGRSELIGSIISDMDVVHHRGSAAELHALAFPETDAAQVWVLHPSGPAIVMGSAQKPEAFVGDFDGAGVELAPRRSGGGAVFIDPDATVWVDVLAPRGSRWWSDDLAQTFLAVGHAWNRALAACGVEGAVFADAPAKVAEARLACWAGLGWGEVTVEGVKIVGLSQRRTRWGARIQGMAVIDGGAGQVADWLDVDAPLRADIRAAVGAHELPVDRDRLEAAVIDALIATA